MRALPGLKLLFALWTLTIFYVGCKPLGREDARSPPSFMTLDMDTAAGN